MLHDEFLADRHRQVGPRRQRPQRAPELLALERHPRRHAPALREFDRFDDYLLLPALLVDTDDLADLQQVRRNRHDFPADLDPAYAGYSIGRWIDEDGDGRYDVLEVETRGPFKGPRATDASGLPLHFDNQSIFKERLRRDKNDPHVMHDEITIIDHALTRPWTVDKRYVSDDNPRPRWPEHICAENNGQIVIGNENYFFSADGLLMPVRKDQDPPDLKYFKRPRK